MKGPTRVLATMLLMLVACRDDESSPTDRLLDASDAPDAADASHWSDFSGEVASSEVGSRVYDSSRVAQLDLEITEEDLAVLREQVKQGFNSDDTTYVLAQLTFDGEVLSDVGIRVKGNSSRRGSGNTPADSDAVPYKLDTNRFVEKQKLDGLTKINLHANDSLNEYLSYAAFRRGGIAASRTGWADVTLNGRSLGLYTLVEQVDERMLANYDVDSERELYKPEPPVGYLTYKGDDVSAYGDLGYKAEKATDHALFVDLVRTLGSEPARAWDRVIDLTSVLEYFAGNVALGNWDTYVAMGHNYYLYEVEPGRMSMLPWDLNLSQAASGSVCPSEVSRGGPGGPGGMRPSNGEGGFPGGMPPEGFEPPAGGFPGGGAAGGPFGGDRSTPLYDGIMNDEGLFADYLATLEAFVDGPGSVEALGSAIDAVVPVLGERVAEEDVEAMRAAIETRVSDIRGKLATTSSCETATAAKAE